MNNKYWIIKTSPFFQTKEFLKILNKGLRIGNYIKIDKTDKVCCKIISPSNSQTVYSAQNAKFMQNLIAWKALGYLKELNSGEILIAKDDLNIEALMERSKVDILQPSNNKQIEKFRFSKIINTLLFAKQISFSDVELNGLSATRTVLTLQKMSTEISKYEMFLSKDKYLIEKMKRRYDETK